jgi:AcrR family transcriptional regulator
MYFTNKEELFKAVVRENVLPLIGEAEQAIGQYDGSSVELLRQIIQNWWDHVGNTRLSGITKLMTAECGNFPELAKFYYEEVISRGNAMIVHMIERGIARGEFRQTDAHLTSRVVVAPVLMLMLWKHSFGACGIEQIPPQEYLDCYIDLLLRGLQNPPSK